MSSPNHWETHPRNKNGEFSFRGKNADRITFIQKILKKILENSDKSKIDQNAKGGSYGELRKETIGKKNKEIHHMPSNEASPLSRWKGPCIILTREEHYKTCSHSL